MRDAPSKRSEGASKTTQKRASVGQRWSAHPELRCVSSPDSSVVGRSFTLDGDSYEFGRAVGQRIHVQDQRMSRRHFRLESSATGYEIIDLDAANGTFVDGFRLEGSMAFEGEVIAAGDTLFVRDRDVDPDLLPSSPRVTESSYQGLVGVSATARALRRSIGTVAGTDGGVLLLGATGTGKEVCARAIHEASGRTGDFVAVNCAAIPAELAEAEFFGSVKGAFTGAGDGRPGYFEQADAGTLFLDEVGDLPAALQAKLLRVLEDNKIRRLGGTKMLGVDVRVVAATHVDLERSDFRRDLLARLGDWILRLPRLAERKADILTLWTHFFGGDDAPEMTAEFQEALLLYDWPMNIRELKKLARRVAELAPDGEVADVHLLPRAIRDPLFRRLNHEWEPSSGKPEVQTPATPVDESGTPGRKKLIEALRASGGNVKQAALDNNWHRTQLYRWLTRLGIDPRSYR